MTTSTIFALSSGAGRAGVAVIRVSGPRALEIGQTLGRIALEPRAATLAKLHDVSGELLDHAVLIFFQNPNSFTGEDVLEIQCHGSPAVIAALLNTLGTFEHCRTAEAGEFTRRAFLNGKMDLTEIEGLSDLLAADTEWQRRAALRETLGGSRALTTAWHARITEARALTEALIDFSDEEDVPESTLGDIADVLRGVRADVAKHLIHAQNAERLRDGLTVVITGAPNAGKSSLLNALARRDVAIVTEEPGTTRDILEVRLDLGGAPVTLIDTAGLRDTDNKIEQEGMRRALARAHDADLILWLRAPDASAEEPPHFGTAPLWIIASKSDIGCVGAHDLSLSAATGQGIDALLSKLHAFARAAFAADKDDAVFMRERHRLLLQNVDDALSQIVAAHFSDTGTELEVLADDLCAAALPMERILGVVDAEEMLGHIFSKFCIGK